MIYPVIKNKITKMYSWNVSPTQADWIGSLGGAAVGGLAGGFAGSLADRGSKKDGSWIDRHKGAVIGASLGAVGGGFGGRELARRHWIKSNLGLSKSDIEKGIVLPKDKKNPIVENFANNDFGAGKVKQAQAQSEAAKQAAARSIIDRHDKLHQVVDNARSNIAKNSETINNNSKIINSISNDIKNTTDRINNNFVNQTGSSRNSKDLDDLFNRLNK